MIVNWSINQGEPDSRFGPEAPDPGYNAIGFPAAWDDRPWIAASFVADRNGLVVGDNLKPEHLLGMEDLATGQALTPDAGREADQWLMRDLRARADAVMWGANTLRIQPTIIPDLHDDPIRHGLRKSHGLPHYPRLVLVTNSGGLDFFLPAFHTKPLEVIILTNETVKTQLEGRAREAKAERTSVVGRGPKELDMAAGLRYLLHALGIKLLLCEGGHSLIESLHAGGFLDEVFVSTSDLAIDPALVKNPRYMFDFAAENARLVAEGQAGGFGFRRWRFNKRN